MLSNLRNFSKSKLAGVLIAIIIVPFVFWGMGSVFSGGNTNSVAKINNENISTQDLINFINSNNINKNIIKENLDKNILDEILSQVISNNLIEQEVKGFNIYLSDQSLFNEITNDTRFIENNEFSRVKYEKFLLENNITATDYEQKIRNSILQKDLFNYISGGIKSPDFLAKKIFIDDNRKIEIEYINLEKVYKKEFSDNEIKKYITENEEKLLREYIDIYYVKLMPDNKLVDDGFNSDFFKRIDDIENDIANGLSLKEISNNYSLSVSESKNFFKTNEDNTDLNEVYDLRNNTKINLLDKEDYFLLYEINNVNKILPEITDKKFLETVLNDLRRVEKFNYNKNILKKIETNNFSENEFYKISNNKDIYVKALVNSINDNSTFNVDSLKLLYTIPINDFLLIVDNEKNVYLTRILNFINTNFEAKSDESKKYFTRSNFKIKNNISSSYDKLLSNKYSIEVNERTLARVENFFK